MELIDPWRGSAQAAQTLAALGAQIQQDQKTQQTQQLADLQMQHLTQQMAQEKQASMLKNQQDEIALSEAQRQIAARDAARLAYANAPATTTQRTIPGSDVGPGAPVANPAYDPTAESKRSSLLADIATAKQSAQQYPGFASLSGLGDRIAAMQKEAEAIPQQAQMVEGERPQGVQENVSTPATPAQRAEEMAKVYEAAGMLDDAKKIREGEVQSLNFDKLMRQQKAEIEAGGGDIDKYYQYKQQMSDIKELITDMSNTKVPATVRQKALAVFQKMHPGVMDGATVEDFTTTANGGVINRYDPQTGQLIGRLVYNPDKGLEFHSETAGDTAHNIHTIHYANGMAQDFQYNPATRAYDKAVGEKYKPTSQQSIDLRGAVQAGNKMSDGAIELAAQQYLIDGKMPQLGMGSVAAKMAILNRAASLAKEQGLDAAGIKSQIADAAAQAGGLKKLTTQFGMMQTFEKTANKNFDLVERLYDQNPQTTIMLLNKLKNNINTKITGDSATVMAGRALQTALMEYAKVVTGQTGGAAVSDSARKEVEALLSLADKPETFHGSVSNHRLEMKNRRESFEEVIADMRKGAGGNSTPQSPEGIARTYKDPGQNTKPLMTDRPVKNPKTGQTGYRQPDGSVRDAQGRRLN